MSRPVWITPGGNLGTFPEAEFYSLPLEVNNPTGSPVTFSFLSGELPPGLQVVRTGKLQGVPVVLDAGTVDETRTYKFTIRASCQLPVVVVDRTFTFTVSNIQPPVITPDVSLIGEFFDGTPIDHTLHAIEVNPNAKLIWSLKSDLNTLPPGITLTEDGHLIGFIGRSISPNYLGRTGYNAQPTQTQVPFSPTANTSVPASQTFGGNGQPYSLVTIEPYGYTQQYEELPYDYTSSVSENKTYTFTVQVFDGANYDTQDYSIKVIAKSSWTTDNDINTVDDSIITVDADQLYSPIVTTTVSSLPVVRQNSNFSFKFSAIDFYQTPLTWSSNITSLLPNLAIDSNTGWLTGHIGTQVDYKKVYTFSVTAANTVPQYNLITTNYITGGVSNTNVTVSNTAGIRPGMKITGNGFTTGQQVNFVYPLDNIVTISYNADTTPSGALTFTSNLTSKPVVYSLTVLGDVNNQIVWDTPELVGVIVNGGISELTIQAHNTLGKDLTYQLVHGSLNDGSPATGTEYLKATKVNFPQGLQLLPSGRIVGRTTFRHFQLDAGQTTIDAKKTNFDNLHSFTVKATAVDNTVADTKTFTIRINNLYTKPYENLYMQALPTIEERRLLKNILNDPVLFPIDSIYRSDDPNFGKAKDFKFLDLPGVEPSTLLSYINAIQKNHYNKIINFGPVKTAVATDPNNNYAVKYEVVYVEVVDPFNPGNQDVTLESNLIGGVNRITNPYYDSAGQSHYIINPNTFDNMVTRISQNLGYSAQGIIPDWMTSVQPDKTVIGFTRALVLAYTKPGESRKIAYRMQDRGISLTGVNYTIDRYLLDNTLSRYYNIDKQSFLSSRETTFDYLSLENQVQTETVDYAITQPFASINNQSLEHILANGGIDSVGSFRNGDRLVFAKQENFNSSYDQDGWIYYTDLYLGNYSDEYDVVDIAYYDSTGYDSAYVIPGYIEKNSTNTEPTLVATANSGDNVVYITYSSTSYVGKLLFTNSFVDYNTTVVSQSVVSGVGSGLSLKLTLSKTLVGTGQTGSKIKLVSYVIVTAVDNVNRTVTVDQETLPALTADRLRLIGNLTNGYGIPDNTKILRLVNNTIVFENYLSDFTIDIRAGDYLGYAVENQRAGIWEVNIDSVTENVTLRFVKELEQGQVVKVMNGRSHGQSFMQYSYSISNGNTVPNYVKVPNVITFNGTNGNRTRFDSGGTKFFDNRDAPSEQIIQIPASWTENTGYDINSTVSYNGFYYIATSPVPPSRVFQSAYWSKYDVLPVSGDKYIKFPKIGVFN